MPIDLDRIHRVERLSRETLLLTKVNGDMMEYVSPNTYESDQRFRAHLATPMGLSTALAAVPWAAIDDNPSNWVYSGGTTRTVTIQEDGQYDIIFQGQTGSVNNIKSPAIFRETAPGVGEYIGGIVTPVGYTILEAHALDQILLAGDKISVVISVSAGTQNLNTARLSIVKRGDPFV